MTDRITTTNSELEAIVLNHGGWYEPKSDIENQYFDLLWQHFDHALNGYKSKLFSDPCRKLRYGFIKSTSLNAFAYSGSTDSGEDFDFIGVNFGAMFTLIFIFRRIFCHPQNFPDIGDVSLEGSPPKPIPFLTLDILKSEFEIISPRCPIRERAADSFSGLAIDFLIFHELTHILQGHTGFVRKLGQTSWTEAFGLGGGAAHYRTRQALELDADFGAILLCMNAVTSRRSTLHESTVADPLLRAAYESCYGTPERAMLSLQFSTYVLFRLGSVGEWQWNQQPNFEHPLPQVRMIWAGLNIFVHLHELPAFKIDSAHFAKTLSPPNIWSAEVACALLVEGATVDNDSMKSVVSNKIHLAYRWELIEEWWRLRPELEMHKRIRELVPPG